MSSSIIHLSRFLKIQIEKVESDKDHIQIPNNLQVLKIENEVWTDSVFISELITVLFKNYSYEDDENYLKLQNIFVKICYYNQFKILQWINHLIPLQLTKEYDTVVQKLCKDRHGNLFMLDFLYSLGRLNEEHF